MFFEKKAAVARLSPTSGDNNKEQYAEITIYRNIDINVQPASAELTAVANGIYGKTYRAFVAVSGIQVGDQITISGTYQKMIVQGVANWFYNPIPHLELTLFEGDN
mgnify:CR=1 FL=1